MIGQLSNDEFKTSYPNATIKSNGKAITKYGKSTLNYWTQHNDISWTNYDCKTI